MPTSLLAAAVPALISGGAGLIGQSLFGNKSSANAVQNMTPTGINAGGLSSNFSGGNINITPSGARTGLVQNLADSFAGLSSEIAGQRPLVAPGTSKLREARLNELDIARAQRLSDLENSRTGAIGNLRENLQRRRVLGSSFGQDAITRAESEFAGEKDRVTAETGAARDRVAAESFLQEMEMTNQLIQPEFQARRSAFQTGLDELNFEADVATKLGAKSTETLSANARFLAELNAKSSAGAGQFFGQTFQPVGKAAGTATSNFFSRDTSVADSGGGA